MWRDYDAFVAELGDKFPHEREGIRRFYDECWRVFDSLNRCAEAANFASRDLRLNAHTLKCYC